MYSAPNDLDFPRFGISVSKSCGSAVQRNRLKRLAREVFRTNQDRIPAGHDYILILSPGKAKVKQNEAAEKSCKPMDYKELERQILELVQLSLAQQH